MEDLTSYSRIGGYEVGSEIKSSWSPKEELAKFFEHILRIEQESIRSCGISSSSHGPTIAHQGTEDVGLPEVMLDESTRQIKQEQRFVTGSEPYLARGLGPDAVVSNTLDQRGWTLPAAVGPGIADQVEETLPAVVASGAVDRRGQIRSVSSVENRSISEWQSQLDEPVKQLDQLRSQGHSLESEQVREQYQTLIERAVDAPSEAFEIDHLEELLEASHIDRRSVRRDLRNVLMNLDVRDMTRTSRIDNEVGQNEVTWGTIRDKSAQFFGDEMTGYFERMEEYVDNPDNLRLEMFKLLLESEARKLPDEEL